MMGRAAYHRPYVIAEVDAALCGTEAAEDWARVIDTMAAYAERHIASGGRLSHVTRHMVGLFQGFPGARRYRQILSTEATRPGAEPDVLWNAFRAVDTTSDRRAA